MKLLGLIASASLALACAFAQSYDYVIAGAGTSGLLLAVALSANPNVTVAVLEAGSDARTDPRITDPTKEGSIQGTVYDWNFTTTTQPGLYKSTSLKAQRGKTIGGTSAMNWMIWNQASAVELDAWSGVLGNQGWNWSVVDTARRQAESFTAPPTSAPSVIQYNPSYHGKIGPIRSKFETSLYSLHADYVIPALKTLGVPFPRDKDNGETNGASYVPLSVDNSTQTRSYSGSAWTAVQGRKNLKVITRAHVSRILWSSTASPATASGLEYLDLSNGNTKMTVTATKQVIVSAGSLQSGQILELSGVGDPSVLSPLGISSVVNLPAVGTQLQDHMNFAGSFSFNKSGFAGGTYAANFMDYVNATRILSAAEYNNATSLFASNTPPSGVTPTSWKMYKKLFASGQPLFEQSWYYGYASTFLIHPLSSGSVHIVSSNPLTAPRIDPAYNSATLSGGLKWDLYILTKAVQYLANNVAGAKPMADIGARFSVNRTLPFNDFQAEIQKSLGSGQHFIGGCILGPRASGGVVDSNLLVYGTRNVRVVDLSVVPYSPGQHPQGLAYSLAMRAAELLLAGR